MATGRRDHADARGAAGGRGALLALVVATGCSDRGSEAPPTTTVPPEGEHRGATPTFVDATHRAGLRFVHDAGRTPDKHLPETMGHGVALADLDEDGDLDLYLVQGGPLVDREARADLPTNATYLNDGKAGFTDHTAASGAAADPGYGMGVAAADVDDDGAVDLFVTNFGADRLVLGDGTGAFRDAPSGVAVSDPRWTTAAAFLDVELDGDLDLFVAAYVAVDLDDPEWCGRREEGWRTVCHPDRYRGLQDRFYRNRGDGSFVEATEEAGLADSWGKGLGAVASDLDGDGFPDLYVANDSVENRLWHNDGHGAFTDATLLSGTGVNGLGVTEAGMGVAAGDLDGDADFDLFVTNFDHESHTLYRNDGGLLFSDATAPAGIEAATRMPVGFGALANDVDDDGDLDLLVANGHIVDLVRLYHDGQTWAQHSQLFLNDGTGRFTDASRSCGDFGSEPVVGRGLAAGDLDGDGDLDLVRTECGGPTRVFLQEGRRADALLVHGAPRGARLIARREDGTRIVREVGPAPSYLSQGSPVVHIGLGGSRVVELTLVRGRSEASVELRSPVGAGATRLMERPSGPPTLAPIAPPRN